MVVSFDEQAVTTYQTDRLKEGTTPKTINEETGMLLRVFGEPGDVLRVRLKKSKKLKLTTETYIGKAYENPETDRMFVAANESRTPVIYMALMLAQKCGFRDGELRKIHLLRINLRRCIQVGTAKTRAGMGGIVPLNTETYDALLNYLSWHGSAWRTTAGVVSLPVRKPDTARPLVL